MRPDYLNILIFFQRPSTEVKGRGDPTSLLSKNKTGRTSWSTRRVKTLEDGRDTVTEKWETTEVINDTLRYNYVTLR